MCLCDCEPLAGPAAPPSRAMAGSPSTTGSPGAIYDHKKSSHTVHLNYMSHTCCFEPNAAALPFAHGDFVILAHRTVSALDRQRGHG